MLSEKQDNILEFVYNAQTELLSKLDEIESIKRDIAHEADYSPRMDSILYRLTSITDHMKADLYNNRKAINKIKGEDNV